MNDQKGPIEDQPLHDNQDSNEGRVLEEHAHEDDHAEKRQDTVGITVDDKPITIHRGSQTVATIKSLAGIAAGYSLTQIVNGRYDPLADDGRVTIKGGEVFESHPCEGGSS